MRKLSLYKLSDAKYRMQISKVAREDRLLKWRYIELSNIGRQVIETLDRRHQWNVCKPLEWRSLIIWCWAMEFQSVNILRNSVRLDTASIKTSSAVTTDSTPSSIRPWQKHISVSFLVDSFSCLFAVMWLPLTWISGSCGTLNELPW